MNTALLMPDDRSPEERARDAFDEMEIERQALEAEAFVARLQRRRRIRAAITPLRLARAAITVLWAFTSWHSADRYSPRVAWLCILCTAWGLASGFLLTFDWLQSGREEREPQ